MSKKKNTLKDLDEFLKQQATTLVPPSPLIEKAEEPEPKKEEPIVQAQEPVPAPVVMDPPQQHPPQEVSLEKILDDLKILSENEGRVFHKEFYDLIVKHLETRKQSFPEDKMLINTALYLKSGANWKEVIREYWRNKVE